MCYMGSKSKIAKWVIDQLPQATNFYDLFGGGGAITHCALLSDKFKNVTYNELNPLTFKAFKMAVNGEFKNERRWISKEDFNKLKNIDPYVAFCFSFGNNPLKSYAYAKDIEHYKKALHYSIFNNDNSLLSEIIDVKNLNYTSNNLRERRLQLQRYLKDYIKDVKSFCNTENGNVRNILQSLERLERLQSLERLERLQKLHSLENSQNLQLLNKSYSDVEIKSNSIVYCDPPYFKTSKYDKTNFDHEAFYNYLRALKDKIGSNKIFISEYSMPSDFICVAEKEKTCYLGSSNNTKTIEKIFTI